MKRMDSSKGVLFYFPIYVQLSENMVCRKIIEEWIFIKNPNCFGVETDEPIR